MTNGQNNVPPAMQLMQYITGHWVTAAMYSAARLGLADQLADGPKSSDELAATVHAHGPSVYRLMRALASLGVFVETQPRCFALTELGQFMRSDHPQSMRSVALFQGAPPHWHGWGAFLHSVRTGEPAFEHVHGKGFFDYCQGDAEFAEAFNGAMTAMSASAAEAVVAAYDFSGIETLVDVGGGHGYLLSAILQANPNLKGIVYDLPHVVEGAKGPLAAAGLADRCQTVSGSFFELVPAADGYIAKNIIHDWDDEHATTILKHMRSSMTGQGRVLLVEAVISDETPDSAAVFLDLEMLHATHGGRERTEGEFADLFRATGFELQRVVPTQSLLSVLEATPV